MKYLRPLSYFLGNSSCLFLSQKKYAQENIDRAHMSICKPSSTPVDVKTKLSTNSETQYHDLTKYQRLAVAL